MKKPRAVVSWSGGKDCCLALRRAGAELEIAGLVTMLTEDGTRTRSHGLRPEVVARQAEALGLPWLTARASWEAYEREFEQLLARAGLWNVSHAVFGDVFPDAHRRWAEAVSRRAGLTAVEPLWGESTRALAEEFIRLGGRALIMAVRETRLDREWLGRTLTFECLDRLEALGIDPGGENGEFHTVATGFPGCAPGVTLQAKGVLTHGGMAFLDFVAPPSTIGPGGPPCA